MVKHAGRSTPERAPNEGEGRVAARRAGRVKDILRVAKEVITEHGSGGPTIEVTAERLGVTKQAIYHYFPSRRALHMAIALDDLSALAERMHAATSAAPDGPAAIEAVIRSMAAHYRGRIDDFRVLTQSIQTRAEASEFDAGDLVKIRPLNDRCFGAAAEKLAEDMREGRLPHHPNPRRLVFSAYLATFGLLSMKAMVERLNDPLGYSDEALIKELCGAFRAAARGGEQASNRTGEPR